MLICMIFFYKKNKVNKGLHANGNLFYSLLNDTYIQVFNDKISSECCTTKSNEEKGRANVLLEKNKKVVSIEIKCHKNT